MTIRNMQQTAVTKLLTPMSKQLKIHFKHCQHSTRDLVHYIHVVMYTHIPTVILTFDEAFLLTVNNKSYFWQKICSMKSGSMCHVCKSAVAMLLAIEWSLNLSVTMISGALQNNIKRGDV